MTADAGFHSHENMRALQQKAIAALVADGQLRRRDERLAGQNGVNLRNFDPKLLELVVVRRFDGADTWTFLE